MRKIVWAVLALATAASAQVVSPPSPQSRTGGRFVAWNYGQWQISITTPPAGTGSQTFAVNTSQVVMADRRTFMPFNTNAQITVGAEKVTLSAVGAGCVNAQVAAGACVLTATFSQTHTASEFVLPATWGLQEALNDAGASGGGVVSIDSAWTGLGGTTAIKNAATLPTNTAIEDVRSGIPATPALAAGSTTDCQYNNGGVLGGDSGCTYGSGNETLTGTVTAAGASFSTSNVTKPPLLSGFDSITCVGDSLTAGTGGTSYCSQLATLTGQTTYNLGIGGQRSGDIAVRANAYAGQTQQTFGAGFTLPASGGGSVTVTVANSLYVPAYNLTAGTGLYPNGVPLNFTIAGTQYVMNCVATGAAPATTMTCTPIVGSQASVVVPNGTAWNANWSTGWFQGATLIRAGRNNYSLCTTSPVTTGNCQVAQDIAAMVAKVQSISGAQFRVFSEQNGDFYNSEYAGYTNFGYLLAISQWEATTYGNGYSLGSSPNYYGTAPYYGGNFIDNRANLLANYTSSNAQDAADYAVAVPPSTLRAYGTSGATGTLTAAITDTVSCNISVSTFTGGSFTVDSETIQVTAPPGGGATITGCVRGAYGTTAATHLNGASFTGWDSTHENTAGYALDASLSQSSLGSTSTSSAVINVQDLNSFFSAFAASSNITLGSISSPGGAHIGLSGNGNPLLTGTFYGNSTTNIGNTGGFINLVGANNLCVFDTSTCAVSTTTAQWIAKFSLIPQTASTYNLGAAAFPWTSTFSNNYYFQTGSSRIYLAGDNASVVVNNNLLPDTTSGARNVGTSSDLWNQFAGVSVLLYNSTFYNQLIPQTLTANVVQHLPAFTSYTTGFVSAQTSNENLACLGTNSIGQLIACATTYAPLASPTFTGTLTAPLYATTTNCASAASPAVCGAAPAGSVLIPTGTTSETLTVNTTAVTANSEIFFYPDDSLGTRLSTTCNSTLATLAGGSFISARVAGTSFTITFNGSILTNGVCGSYHIIN
jgi:hypothetical protein